jgi:hypothetical protein
LNVEIGLHTVLNIGQGPVGIATHAFERGVGFAADGKACGSRDGRDPECIPL